MTTLSVSKTVLTLGITCIAANKSEMTILYPKDADMLRVSVANFAPKAHFYICYFHPKREVWYRVHDPQTKAPMVYKSPFLTKSQAETVWTRAQAMWRMETQGGKSRSKSRKAEVIDFPKTIQ